MKLPVPTILLILTFGATVQVTTHVTAQKTTTYYDWNWKPSDSAHARFVTLLEHTDSGWHRLNYYVQGPVIQMEGWYEDSACQTPSGKFVYAYPDKKVKSTGRFVHGLKQGCWLNWHPNGAMADSAVYKDGTPNGTTLRWYQNGMPADSAVYHPDSSGIEVSWFDNGKPSAAGSWAAGHNRQGRWKFFHDNGQLSALERYDNGQLLQKQYFDEKGNQQADTTTKDSKSYFGRNPKNWRAWHIYLDDNVEFPSYFRITKSDEAAVVVTFTIDVNGHVKDAYIKVPFYGTFNTEVLRTILNCPKWHPAIDHNRRVEDGWSQSIVFKNGDLSTTVIKD